MWRSQPPRQARRDRARSGQRHGEDLFHRRSAFRRGRIQDLELDLDLLESQLRDQPVHDGEGFLRLESRIRALRAEKPLIADESIDVVVSNCVLNLVDNKLKQQMFREIYRVLGNGGRAVISDIVSDEPVPLALQQDGDLWSGCISGAMTEEGFLRAFEGAGFHGVRIVERGRDPWRTIERAKRGPISSDCRR